MLNEMINLSFEDAIVTILKNKKNKRVTLKSLRKDPSIYYWFDDWLRHDCDIVMESLKQN